MTDLLRQRIRAVFRHLPKGLAGDEEAIHQMRVAGRRLRAALPLLARKPEGRRVHRALRVLRELARTAGASRDLDVGLELLTDRLHAVSPVDPEQRLLRTRLRAARARSRTRMAEALMDLEIARLRRDLRAVVAKGGE
ncbi:MAG TPA: CHAD domain-containing protein, partial [Vicinamibacteria bacterium]